MIGESPVRRCTGPCGRTLPANTEHFYRKSSGKYGLRADCKECCKEYKKVHYARPEVKEYKKEHKKAYDTRPGMKEYKKEYMREYRKGSKANQS